MVGAGKFCKQGKYTGHATFLDLTEEITLVQVISIIHSDSGILGYKQGLTAITESDLFPGLLL